MRCFFTSTSTTQTVTTSPTRTTSLGWRINLTAMREILSCDLLILDDLGAEFATAYSQSVLYQVINDRMTEGRATIISTNLDLPALSKAYNERILSRLIGSYTMLGFVGRDIRQQKLARRREGNT